jgi:hypothetical protein
MEARTTTTTVLDRRSGAPLWLLLLQEWRTGAERLRRFDHRECTSGVAVVRERDMNLHVRQMLGDVSA